MYFVIQKKHKKENDSWDNNVIIKTNKYDAFHQFHAFMSTYGYGHHEAYDYIACSIEDEYGSQEKIEIDDRKSSAQEIQEEQ